MKIIKKEYRPYGVMIVTAEIDGKPVTKRLKAGISDTEIKKAFGEVTDTSATVPVAEPKKGTKK
jgi:response regulator of citrate/malate metabolism